MNKLTSILARTTLIFGAVAILFGGCKKKVDAPTADFTFEVSGQTVTFTFTGDGEVDTYAWDFGDGETASSENPSHTYAAGGTYTVKLTVSNDGGDDSATETVEVSDPAVAENPSLTFGDADGAFYAINTVTITSTVVGDVETKLGASVAWFTDGTNMVDVGTVTVKQGSMAEALTLNDNNTYSWTEPATAMQGFTNDGVSWTIEGGNGHPSIGGSGVANMYPFPSAKKIDESSDNISGGSAYTLSHDGAIDGADSTYFSIFGPEGNLMKRAGSGVSSADFTASEMASLGTGIAIMQIASFKVTYQDVGDKRYYAVLESVASKTVTIE